MAFFVVIAIFAVVANLLADLVYAVLDPRIRITELRPHDDADPGTARPDARARRGARRRRRAEPRAEGGRRAQPGPDRPPPVPPPQGGDGLADRADPDRRCWRRRASAGGRSPGWWKYDYNTVVPPNPDQTPDDVAAARRGSAARASQFGDHPFGLDNEKARDMFALTMRGVQQTLVVIFVLAVARRHDRRGARRPRRLLRAVGRLGADALHRRHPRHPAPAHRRRRRRSASAPPASGASRSCSGCSVDRVWPGSCGPSSWPCASGSSSTPPGSPARPTGGSSSSTSCPTPSARSSSSTTLLMGAGILTEAALELPRLRHPAARRVARLARQRLPGRLLEPPVAVHLARRVHRRHRAVPAVHRRRPARRLRPAPEADPQAQGPREARAEADARSSLAANRTIGGGPS